MKQKPSFKPLAKVAKGSPASITRVAKGQVNINPDIRARVRKAAETLGTDLERQRKEKTNIVAFLLASRDFLHNFQARILFSSEAYCASQERELLFMSNRSRSSSQQKWSFGNRRGR